ncbi:toll/interleukin-1 receptor domain-containing protein [Pyxidicoccus sp. 3LG]
MSHAAHDAAFVNFFVDTLLVGGIGIPSDKIFNTSAPTSPITSGNNFSPDIRAAIQSAKIVIALITPRYFERPFAMAELGAAWAAQRLMPVLVPPVDFSMLEGVLDGVQCIRANDKKALHEIFDRFDQDKLNKERWFTRNGTGTFSAKLEEFLAGLPSKLPKAPEPTSAHVMGKVPQGAKTAPKPEKPPLSLKEEQALFVQLIAELNDALSHVPWIVRDAFVHDACGHLAKADPANQTRMDAVWDAKHRGLVEIDDEDADEDDEVHFLPTRASQRARNVYAALDRLRKFLASASSNFHLAYEDEHKFPAAVHLYPFWEAHIGLAHEPPAEEEQ